MDFTTIAQTRQSCRRYDPTRAVEDEKLQAILESARLAPSACNGQPYHLTVCRGDVAKRVASAVMGMGMNKFAADAPIMIVISEEPYVATAAFGAKVKGIDYRSIDIGIVAAYITAEAAAQVKAHLFTHAGDIGKCRQNALAAVKSFFVVRICNLKTVHMHAPFILFPASPPCPTACAVGD